MAKNSPKNDPEMESVLEKMLANDEDITARAVVRSHAQINAASSITRSEHRRELLTAYQAKQTEYRGWRHRLARQPSAALDLDEKDIYIRELEKKLEWLTVSHGALMRIVGELGGFDKWQKVFSEYAEFKKYVPTDIVEPQLRSVDE